MLHSTCYYVGEENNNIWARDGGAAENKGRKNGAEVVG